MKPILQWWILAGLTSILSGWNGSMAQGKFTPSQIKVGIDLVEPAISLFNDEKFQLEANGDIDFGRFYLSADMGYAKYNRDRFNFSYSSKGQYFRLGPDVNFLVKDPDHNAIFFGLRYGISFYNDQARYLLTDSIYGDLQSETGNSAVTAHWFEMTTGMKIKVWKQFFMGYTVRFKFALRLNGLSGSLTSFDVPGYGLANEGSAWGFNYHIFYQIPLRKKPVPEKQEP